MTDTGPCNMAYCPDADLPPRCCRNCANARKAFVTDKNRHLWGPKGFWSENGCKLSRDEMPPECKAYDCRKERFIYERTWENGKWDTHPFAKDALVIPTSQIPPGYELILRKKTK